MRTFPVIGKILFLLLAALVLCPLPGRAGPLDWTTGEKIPMQLKRGTFVVLRYPATLPVSSACPKALIIFGSGCGGWSYWEENVCHRLQADGCEVLGIDFALYSQADYDQATLEADYQTLVQTNLAPYGEMPVPVILGGWSTGAEQAAVAASGPHPPIGLAGLLLVSPGNEGGYGSYATNYLYLDAPAAKVFFLTDLAPKLSHLRVAQWHASLDPLDSRAWLPLLKTAHREYDFGEAIHDYRGACPAFLNELGESVSWILNPGTGPASSAKLASQSH